MSGDVCAKRDDLIAGLLPTGVPDDIMDAAVYYLLYECHQPPVGWPQGPSLLDIAKATHPRDGD